nr:heat shock factor-binding protein 1 [Quercus suber]
MDGHDGEDPKQSTADMTVFVQNLLQQMQTRFQQMSDSIVTKNILDRIYEVLCLLNCYSLDEMGGRINELEQSINDLRAEMGVESSPSPVPPTKPQLDDVKKEEGSA